MRLTAEPFNRRNRRHCRSGSFRFSAETATSAHGTPVAESVAGCQRFTNLQKGPTMTFAAAAVANPHTSDVFETLWDANDVARYLKGSHSWVYQRAEMGLLPYVR